MSEKGHIVHKSNRTTVQQKYKKGRKKENVQSKLTKRGLNKTHERPTRYDNTPIP